MSSPQVATEDNKLKIAPLRSHLPSLDGMRAVSILLVILAHGSGAFNHQNDYFDFLAQLGVSTFFVISGLLISWLMIRERDATGSFSLSNFYVRRLLRIMPVYWLLLLCVSALKVFKTISISWIDIVRALTFTHNYPLNSGHSVDYSWWLHHTWSLSLEEQFYLVWPSLFAFLPRRFVPRLAVILAFSGPILRVLNYYFLPSFRGADASVFQTRIDILMAGCASAFLLESPAKRDWIRKIPVWPTLVGTTTMLLVVCPYLSFHFPAHTLPAAIANTTLPTVEAIAIAVTLLVVVAGRQGTVFRVLNWRFFTHIGKLSYSLYIWQQLFLEPFSATNVPSLVGRLLAAYVVAFCSFSFFERPLLKLRGRFRRGVSV